MEYRIEYSGTFVRERGKVEVEDDVLGYAGLCVCWWTVCLSVCLFVYISSLTGVFVGFLSGALACFGFQVVTLLEYFKPSSAPIGHF